MHKTADGTPVWIEGAGRTLVLIHGVLVDHRMWRRQTAALSPHCRTIVYGMLGHGDAPDPPGPRCLDDFVAQLEKVIDECGDGSSPIVLGFSMGALIAQAYAISHPENLLGLILMNSVYDRTPKEREAVGLRLHNLEHFGIENVIEAAMERWHSEAERRTHPQTIAEMMNIMRSGNIESKTKAYRVFATGDVETAGKLSEVTCPSLVLTGDGDRGSPPHMSEKMASELPNAKLLILTGQRHQMPVIAPDLVNQAILDFMQKLP